MAETRVPWWRKVIQFAIKGIRAVFGLDAHNSAASAMQPKTGSDERAAQPEPVEEQTELKEIHPISAPESAPALNPAEQETAAPAPEPITPMESEVPAPKPEPAAEPPVGPESAEESIAEESVDERTEDQAEASEPEAMVLIEPQPAPEAIAPESQPAEPEPDEPSPVVAPPKPVHEPVRREEGPDNLPVSVIVSQVYEGPLDLLLDLIRKQDIDIYDIPIAQITAQFLAYVNRLRASDVDVAGEFIYTASLLIHIKSRMLLPREPAGDDGAQEDPRRELVERLLEHERFKNAAQMLQQKQMLEAASWTNPGLRDFKADSAAEPEIAADTMDLVRVFRDILERARSRPVMNLQEDSVTVGQMVQFLSRRLTMEDKPVALRRLLSHTQSERALIAMFLALLEMVRLQAILLRQDRHFSEIFIKKSASFESVMNQNLARDDWQ